jgi:hypothetical protein
MYRSFVLYDVSFFGNLTLPLPIKLIQIMFGVPGEKSPLARVVIKSLVKLGENIASRETLVKAGKNLPPE